MPAEVVLDDKSSQKRITKEEFHSKLLELAVALSGPDQKLELDYKQNYTDRHLSRDFQYIQLGSLSLFVGDVIGDLLAECGYGVHYSRGSESCTVYVNGGGGYSCPGSPYPKAEVMDRIEEGLKDLNALKVRYTGKALTQDVDRLDGVIADFVRENAPHGSDVLERAKMHNQYLQMLISQLQDRIQPEVMVDSSDLSKSHFNEVCEGI